MTSSITQADLQQLSHFTGKLIAAIQDARIRHPQCARLRARPFSALARMLHGLKALPAHSDYRPFGPVLKRRIVRANSRLNGSGPLPDSPRYALRDQLPAQYQDAISSYAQAASRMMHRLVDVPLTRAPLQSVADILAQQQAPVLADGWLSMDTAPRDGTSFLVPPQDGYILCFWQDGWWWHTPGDLAREGFAIGPAPLGWKPVLASISETPTMGPHNFAQVDK